MALFGSCAMWTHYGVLKGDTPLTVVNVIGLMLQVVYIVVFWKYSASKVGLVVKFLPDVVLYACVM